MLVPLGVHLHAKFRISGFYPSWDTEGVPKFQNGVTWRPRNPHWPKLSFFSLVPHGVHLHFEYLASTVPEIRRWSQNSKNWVTWPPGKPLDLSFHFFHKFPSGLICVPNFEFLASTVPEIRRWSQNSKIGSRDPHRPKFSFFMLVPLGVHLHAKFWVSSFNCSRDTKGSQNFKIGSRDPLVTPVDLIFHFFH